MLQPKNIKAHSLLSAALLFASAACVPLSVIPLAGAAGAAPKPAAPALEYQSMTFPERLTVAKLDLNVPCLDAKGNPTTRPERVTARGKIKIPTTATINIVLAYDGLEQLPTLAQLNPAQVIQFNAASLDLDDGQFALIKRFTSIFRINLDSTMVTDKSLATLGCFKSLSDLRISKVDIAGDGFEALNGLPLHTLNLAGSNLKEGNLQKIKTLPQFLVSLNCSNTKVGDSDMPFIAKCQKLTGLDLSGDKKLTDACVKDITKLKLLDTLHILDTSITEKSLPALANMPHLTKLVVRSSTFWKTGSGKSPRDSLKIVDAVTASRTPVDVFYPLH
jgi:hypothetical protein